MTDGFCREVDLNRLRLVKDVWHRGKSQRLFYIRRFCLTFTLSRHYYYNYEYYAPVPRVGGLSDDARLTSDVCLSRTSGLSREQKGLGRLQLAQR